MTCLVWHVDVGNIREAVRIAEYALAHDLVTPEQYKRDTATLVVEEMATATFKEHGPKVSPDDLIKIEVLTHDRDMPDQVRAKLHKAIGTALSNADDLAISDPDMALSHLKRALELDGRAGVKKIIEQLERRRKHSDAGEAPAGDNESADGVANGDATLGDGVEESSDATDVTEADDVVESGATPDDAYADAHGPENQT